MRKSIERTFLNLVRLYTFNTPIGKGKYRLYQTALALCRFPPDNILAKTTDGRLLQVDLTGKMHETVFFVGEYERAVTQMLSSVIKPGDVCFDVGANFGWYTTLFYQLSRVNGSVGKTGTIHAFEPLPEVFRELRQNWILAGSPENVYLNNLAVGDENRVVNLHRFTDLPSGHTSLADMGKSDFQSFQVQMITLDSYLIEKQISNVNFIKVDIEGAELMFLRGASKLFKQDIPPVFMVEMAIATTSGFGYTPNDLIDFIGNAADYKFFWLDDERGTLRQFEKFAADDAGAHVLCVPANCEPERLSNLKIVN